MPTFETSDGVRHAYTMHGEGMDVLLIHGWMVDSAAWQGMVDASRGPIRYIVPDLRGAGDSDKPADGYTLERYRDDLTALLNHLDVTSVVVVGHSMGGAIAQLLAADEPQRCTGLVLFCPVPTSGMELPSDAVALFANSGENRDMQRTILNIASPGLDPTDRERLLDAAAQIPEACIRQSFDAWTRGGFEQLLPSIAAPTVVVASSDPFLPEAFLQQAVVDPIPRARLTLLPGPGHYVQVEQPAQTAAVLGAFLAGLATQ